MIGVQVRIDDHVDAGQVEVLLTERSEAGIHVGQQGVQLGHAGIYEHTSIGMLDDVHVDGHALAFDGQVGNEDWGLP